MRAFVALAVMALVSGSFAACSFPNDVGFGADANGSGNPSDPNDPNTPLDPDGNPLPPDTKPCTTDNECGKDLQCVSGGCYPATATDGKQNGRETDVDCGGGQAPRCDDGKGCRLSSDCNSKVCGADNRCQAPRSDDGVINGGETDRDCGGPSAPACGDGLRCVEARDCGSLNCHNGTCLTATTTDGIKNGEETDVDCGGPSAPACAPTKACLEPRDCNSQVCTGNVCQAPSYTDNVKNGEESDVDCGGPNAPAANKCIEGRLCGADSDCQSDGCIREGAHAGKCAKARSCTTVHGGFTCGAGETNGDNPAAAHEDCCTSLAVPGYAEADRPGQTVLLDKYEVTGGRIREFLRRTGQWSAALNQGDKPDVKSWLETTGAPPRWEAGWTQYLPSDAVGGNVNGEYGATPVGVNYALSYAQYIYVHAYNCNRRADQAEYSSPTYWFDDATLTNLFAPQHPRNAAFTRQILDQKSINCLPNALLAAFCAWDGGQLATAEVLSQLNGGLPALNQSNNSSDGGQAPQYNYPILNSSDASRDGAGRIAAPGRMTGDATMFNGAGPWMDLRGNLNEVALCKSSGVGLGGNACGASDGPGLWFGLLSQGYGYSSARALAVAVNVRLPQYKSAYAGGRCMRFR